MVNVGKIMGMKVVSPEMWKSENEMIMDVSEAETRYYGGMQLTNKREMHSNCFKLACNKRLTSCADVP